MKYRHYLVFAILSAWVSLVIFLIQFWYSFSLILATLFSLLTLGMLWAIFLARRKQDITLFPYVPYLSKKVISHYDENKATLLYGSFLSIRLLVAILLTILSLMVRFPFLMVTIFVLVTESLDSVDSVFIYGMNKEKRDPRNFFDDTVDISGRILFYFQFFVLWINILNLIQVILLILILIFGFKHRWIKIFGIDINLGAILYFSPPPFNSFFVIGIISSWLLYVFLYSSYIYRPKSEVRSFISRKRFKFGFKIKV